MRSHVCFDIFHLDRLRQLIEVRDVSRPPFLEDIEELHNAFSIQSPHLWSTIRDRWCRELGLSRTPLLTTLTCSYWGIPPFLAWWHQFLHVHMQSISLGDVWHRCLDILHIQLGFFIQQSASKACLRSDSSIFIDLVGVYTGAYPMHFHVRVFRRMMVFGDAFS